MQPEKKLQVPLLREAAEVETFGQPFSVDCVNWPADFPFAPSCSGHIGHTSDALVVNFRVSGPDLRAVNLTDDGRSWEDSACECFVQVPGNREYYNFEVNPAGFLVAAHGPDVHHRTSIGPEAFARIRRICRVEGIGPITKPIEARRALRELLQVRGQDGPSAFPVLGSHCFAGAQFPPSGIFRGT